TAPSIQTVDRCSDDTGLRASRINGEPGHASPHSIRATHGHVQASPQRRAGGRRVSRAARAFPRWGSVSNKWEGAGPAGESSQTSREGAFPTGEVSQTRSEEHTS